MFILQTGGPSRGMTSLRVNDRGELIKGRGNLEQGLQVCSHLLTVGNVAESLPESVKSVRSVSDSGCLEKELRLYESKIELFSIQ